MSKYPALVRFADMMSEQIGLDEKAEIELGEISGDIDATYLVLELIIRGFLSAPFRSQMALLSSGVSSEVQISRTALYVVSPDALHHKLLDEVHRFEMKLIDLDETDCLHWLSLALDGDERD